MSEYPDHLQLRNDLPVMAKNKNQKKQRAAAAAASSNQKKQSAAGAMATSSMSNQKKQTAAAAAASSSMSNQQDQETQSAAAPSDSQDSMIGAIIKQIKGFTIDSAESVLLNNDKADYPSDQSEPVDQSNILNGPSTNTKAKNTDKGKGKGKAKEPSTETGDDLDSEWEQVHIHGNIKAQDIDSDDTDDDSPIKGISKGKAIAKPTSPPPAADDSSLDDRDWEQINHPTSENENTIFTLDADRHLCTLWFFTTHSFSTIASLLNYSLPQPLAIRIHGQEAKNRFLELAKSPDYARAFVYHEVKRLSLVKDVDWKAPIQQTDRMFTEAWARMQDDVSKECEVGEKRVRNGFGGVVGYDGITDDEYIDRFGKERLWSVEERKALQGRPWGGLGSKVTRPEGEELGSHLDVYMQGVRAEETMTFGKKKGLLGFGMFGL